jgi:uncharacterized membrane protein
MQKSNPRKNVPNRAKNEQVTSKQEQPEDNRQGESFQIAMRREMFSGPLPPPDILQKYNEVIPDAANRILLMAEKEQEHRFSLKDRSFKYVGRGQTLALIIALSGLGCAGVLGYFGNQVAASVVGGVSLVTMVFGFLRGGADLTKHNKE